MNSPFCKHREEVEILWIEISEKFFRKNSENSEEIFLSTVELFKFESETFLKNFELFIESFDIFKLKSLWNFKHFIFQSFDNFRRINLIFNMSDEF